MKIRKLDRKYVNGVERCLYRAIRTFEKRPGKRIPGREFAAAIAASLRSGDKRSGVKLIRQDEAEFLRDLTNSLRVQAASGRGFEIRDLAKYIFYSLLTGECPKMGERVKPLDELAVYRAVVRCVSTAVRTFGKRRVPGRALVAALVSSLSAGDETSGIHFRVATDAAFPNELNRFVKALSERGEGGIAHIIDFIFRAETYGETVGR